MRVVGASSALSLTESGVFIVPSSTPGFLLVEFLTKGMQEASLRMEEFNSHQEIETKLVSQCINELGLIQLDRDDNVTQRYMIACCSK